MSPPIAGYRLFDLPTTITLCLSIISRQQLFQLVNQT
jgi:hypothetical protein